MREEWRDIVDFENLYEISNLGNFRRKSTKQARAININKSGYQYIDLCNKGKKSKKTVHQAVAAAFLPNFMYGMHINHKDGNKLNNYITNLELTDYSENNAHAHALGLNPKPGKSKYYNVSIQLDKRAKKPKPKYVASLKLNGKRHYIGSYSEEIEAAKAVDNYLNSIGDTIRQRNFP